MENSLIKRDPQVPDINSPEVQTALMKEVDNIFNTSTFSELNKLPSAASLKASTNVNREVNFAKHIAEKILEASRNGEYKLVIDSCISEDIKKILREKKYSITCNEKTNETIISWDVAIG